MVVVKRYEIGLMVKQEGKWEKKILTIKYLSIKKKKKIVDVSSYVCTACCIFLTSIHRSHVHLHMILPLMKDQGMLTYIDSHFIREHVQSGFLNLVYVKSLTDNYQSSAFEI